MRPAFWRRIPGQWSYLLRIVARRPEDDVDAELRFHFDERIAELMAQGASPETARGTATQEFGDVDAVRARLHEIATRIGNRRRRAAWWEGVMQDLRFVFRGLRRNPGFTATVVSTLALGIGANTATFTVVYHLLLAPLPYPDGNRIVQVATVPAGNAEILFGASTVLLRQWEARSRTLYDFSGISVRPYRLGSEADHDTVAGAAITPSFATTLRVRPMVGRAFNRADALSGAAPVVMISYGLWQARYGGIRDVLGKAIDVNGIPRVIIGVTPMLMGAPMSHDAPPQVWLPMNLDSVVGANAAFARLRPGATSAAAARELQAMPEHPDSGWRARVVSAQDRIDAKVKGAVEVLFIAAGGLLLIACANVANLLLMRAWTRQRELVIRRALGASRLRIARHVLTESLMLAALGGALGLLIAWRGLRMIVVLRPGLIGDLDAVRIDSSVLLWTTTIAVTSGFLFGAAPALLSGEQSIGDRLRAGVRAATGSTAARRLRGGMVVAEIALSFVFLVAAGLLVRSFVALERTSIGYDRANLVSVGIQLAHPPAPGDRDVIAQTLVRSLSAVPGVRQAALGEFPAGLGMIDVRPGPFAIEGPAGPQTIDLQLMEMQFVGTGYFSVVRLPLLQGRGFGAPDASDATREVVVSEALAHRFWPGGHALGAKLRVKDTWLTVVGVAGDLHLPSLPNEDIFNLQMYRPASATARFASSVVLRVSAGASGAPLERLLKLAVENAGVSATLRSVDPAESRFDHAVLEQPRFALILFGVFATLALAVSAVGLYAIVAYAVTQRTREIGVRMALGAVPAGIARLILGDAIRLAMIGCGIGVVGAYAATRAMTALQYGVSATDPIALGAAAVLLIAVVLIATFVPVRRALRVDPIEVLRAE